MRHTAYPREADEQKALFRWKEYAKATIPELGMMFHVPNGGYRNPREARNLSEEGVVPGVPDILLPVPRGGYHGLFIELKRVKGGRVSEEQRAWLDRLNGLGYLARVCRGWLDARNVILKYLKEEKE